MDAEELYYKFEELLKELDLEMSPEGEDSLQEFCHSTIAYSEALGPTRD